MVGTSPEVSAVILAAGRGTRMGVDHPKCLQPVAGRPIIEWTLGALRANGIERVTVIGGHRAESLMPLSSRGIDVRINERFAATNMVRSLQCAGDLLQQSPTIVLYGDGAYGPTAIAEVIRGFTTDVAVPVDRRWLDLWRLRFDDPLADAETLATRDGRIVSIGRRPSCLDEVEGQFMGLLALQPHGWRAMASHLACVERDEGAAVVDRMDCTTMLGRMIDRSLAIDCIDVDGGWCEFDSPQDCVAVEQAMQASTVPFMHDFRR
jgi:choline kinase